jgi:ribosomal-protein-alanine N-acetyltransferase
MPSPTPAHDAIDPIRTTDCTLIAGTQTLVDAEWESVEALAAMLGVHTPADWPPPLNDRDSLRYMREKLTAIPDHAGWWLWYVITRDAGQLVGSAGYNGPAGRARRDRDRLRHRACAYHRRGYASQAIHGLLDWARTQDGVKRVIAHTLPDLTPSIGVLEKCGFARVDETTEPRILKFARGV